MSYRPDDVSTSPTAWWKLDEYSTGAAPVTRADSIGSLDLIDTPAAPSAAGLVYTYAIDFVSNDYLDHVDNTAFDFSGGVFSLVAWIKCDTLVGTDAIWENYTNTTALFSFRLEAGILNARVLAGSEVVNVVGKTTLSTGTKYHVGLVEDGNDWKLYLDGVDDTDSGGTDASRCGNYTGDLRVGTNITTADDFDGKMNDLAIWKGYAVTPAEMLALANDAAPSPPSTSRRVFMIT